MTNLQKVLQWFDNHILSLNEGLANADSSEKEDWQEEIDSATEARFLLSSSMPNEAFEDEEEEEFCSKCDFHGQENCHDHH